MDLEVSRRDHALNRGAERLLQIGSMIARARHHAGATLQVWVGASAISSAISLSVPFWPMHAGAVLASFGGANVVLAVVGFGCAGRAFREADGRHDDNSAIASLQALGTRATGLGSLALAMVFLVLFVRWGLGDQLRDLVGRGPSLEIVVGRSAT